MPWACAGRGGIASKQTSENRIGMCGKPQSGIILGGNSND